MGNAPGGKFKEQNRRSSVLDPSGSAAAPPSSDSPTSSAGGLTDPFHPANFQKGPFRKPSLTVQTEPAPRPRLSTRRRTNSDAPNNARPPLPDNHRSERILGGSERVYSIGNAEQQPSSLSVLGASTLTLDTTSSTGAEQEESLRRREVSESFYSDRLSDSASDASARGSLRMERDLLEVSEILPWLYLGGDVVAKSKTKLREKGITHVLNAARTVCENYHEGDSDLEYVSSMNLTDEVGENIDHFMIQAIADIERVKESNGRILVHCHQGISRSATLVIAYLMWLQGMDYNQAYRFVKDKRTIVNPNLGFVAHLMAFEERLRWRPTTPTLHRVAPHSSKDGTLVVKLVVMPDGSKRPVVPTAAYLDPRGAFLLHSPKDRTMYLWVGPDVGVAAVTEAAARAAARAAQMNRRGSSTRVRESYEEAGRRVGRMMCKFEPAYRGCDLVQVPVNEHAGLALAKDANPTSLAARFWRTLGEEIGSTKGIDALRNARPKKRWSEDEDSGVVAYVDEASSARLALTGVETVHEAGEDKNSDVDKNDDKNSDVDRSVVADDDDKSAAGVVQGGGVTDGVN